MDKVIAQAREKMTRSVDATAEDFAKIRTGRASPALVEGLKVEAYGDSYPLNQLATISAPEPRLLTVVPFDSQVTKDIERAILTSDLGLTPQSDGKVIRLPVPPLTQERREELSKMVRNKGEDGKVAVRNVRREAMDAIKKMEKAEGLSSDEMKAGESELQELTEEHCRRIDKTAETKAAELMEV
jgi:ribosome recycling factor